VFAEAGGLLSYGPDDVEGMEQCVSLVSRVLGGANPGDLPIARSTRFPLIINVRTAEALRLNIPDSVLLSANRVIR
jgi:putative ABC transport system substrate-binding protein